MKKKFKWSILSIVLALLLTACSAEPTSQTEQEESYNVLENTEEQSEEEETITSSEISMAEEMEGNLLSIQELPVDAADGLMIIQDEATSQYGLIDQNGREILPCEYNAMKFLFVNRFNPKTYVAVQSRGSYGVYDTSGQEVVAPLYDDIEGGEYTDTFTVKSHDVYGVVNLEGQEIIPVEYEYIANSAQRMIGALKKEGSDRTLSLYMENGTLQNSFPVEIALSANGTQLSFLDIEGQTVASIDLQSECTAVVGGSFDLDAGTGNLVGVISVCTYGEDGTPAKMSFYMVCLGETSSITLYYELIPEVPSINYGSTSMNPFEERSRFYQGSAFEITKDGKIYKVDVSGQRSELAAPFSYTASGPGIITGCRLLENYAVMNNNGYVYVIDKNGNTAFSEDEYEGAPFTSYAELGHQSGLVILKTVDGQTQVIDSYGNIIIPSGHEFSRASLLDQTGEMVDDYSMLYDETEDIYYFVDEYEHHVLEAHEPMDEQFAQQLFSGQGWILLDEEAEKLLAVVPSTDGYQICDVAALP